MHLRTNTSRRFQSPRAFCKRCIKTTAPPPLVPLPPFQHFCRPHRLTHADSPTFRPGATTPAHVAATPARPGSDKRLPRLRCALSSCSSCNSRRTLAGSVVRRRNRAASAPSPSDGAGGGSRKSWGAWRSRWYSGAVACDLSCVRRVERLVSTAEQCGNRQVKRCRRVVNSKASGVVG